MFDGWMMTYEQQKLGLSAYYDKRWVLPDCIHTEPIEYHQGRNPKDGETDLLAFLDRVFGN